MYLGKFTIRSRSHQLLHEPHKHTHTHAHANTYAGLERKSFDNKTVSFEKHVKEEHNMWHYLYFIVLIKVKDPTEFTGPESYVYGQVEVNYCIFYHLKIGYFCFNVDINVKETIIVKCFIENNLLIS